MHTMEIHWYANESDFWMYGFMGLSLFFLTALVFMTIKYRKVMNPVRDHSSGNLSIPSDVKDESEGYPDKPADEQDPLIQIQMELQMKEQDLMYHALLITEMKQVNKSIGEKLSPFQYKFPRKKDQDDFLQTLLEIIRDTARDPMEDFEAMFRQMHGGFYEKLLGCCPELTRSELQICALLRMNLSSKDMARLTNLSVSTIDVTRHRIRKKLSVDPQASLTGFLIQFS